MAIRIDEPSDVYQDTSGTGLPSGNFTFTCWAYMSVDRAALSCIWSLQDSVFSNWYVLGANSDRTVTIFTNGNNLSPATAAITVAGWYKFAFTLSGTTGTFYAATEAGSLTQVSSGTVTTHTPQQLYIGSTSSPDQWINGRVAAVKIWTAALTQPQCAAELDQFDPVIAANLLRYYKLKVAETTDYSGNGFSLAEGGTTPAVEADPPIPDVVASGPTARPGIRIGGRSQF